MSQITLAEALQTALEHQSAGRLAEAQQIYQRILAVLPDNSDTLYLAAMALHQGGEQGAALEHIERAVALCGDFADYRILLAKVLDALGEGEKAMAEFRKAVDLAPDLPSAHNALGVALRARGLFADALVEFQRACQLQPDAADFLLNLSNAQLALGDFPAAGASAQKALALGPENPDAHTMLGDILQALRQFPQAEECFRRALALDPRHGTARHNLGNAVLSQNRPTEAMATFRQAIAENPRSAEAHNSLGNALRMVGEIDQAIAAFRASLAVEADPITHSNLLFTMHYSADADPGKIFPEHLNWARQYAANEVAPPQPRDRPRPRERSSGRPLRIGYVSPDFCGHVVAYFIKAALSAHDRRNVEIFCYASVALPDDVTAQLRHDADHWRDVHKINDQQLAELVRADQIDILVDLAGHTAGHRLLAFARKPAPIQVTYLGYPDTSGLKTMDYRLTDAVADPMGLTERFHTEQLVRLPDCFLCYTPPKPLPPPAARAPHPPTFGSFNTLAKITPQVIGVWSRILLAVPNSRLIMMTHGAADDGVRQRLYDQFASHGVGAARLVLPPRLEPQLRYLQIYDEVDIVLDPFPYNGTTTTCEAMWMGAAVVTLAGKMHVSRVGASLLRCMGLNDLVANDIGGYIDIAARLAADSDRQRELRLGLRERMRASPLTDAKSHAGALEAAYRRMWENWLSCADPI